MFVVPPGLALASIIFGFNAIVQWLATLGDRAISAAKRCAELLLDVAKMREWVEKLRRNYKIGTAVVGSLTNSMTNDLHEALDAILLSCNEVESLAERIGRSRLGALGTSWKALVNESKIKKSEETLKQTISAFQMLQASASWAREIERQEEEQRRRDCKCQGEAEKKAKKQAAAKSQKEAGFYSKKTDDSPPPYNSTMYTPPAHSRPAWQIHQERENQRNQEKNWALVQTASKTVGGAGAGCLAVVGIVAVCNPVTGLAAVAGATVYGLVAAGGLGGAALGWSV